jgi:RNA polymerase sigma-70 factor, ECF subfamily
MKLYTPLAGNLFAFCLAKTHNREEAKELVSETILASYENFHTLKNEKAFLSFLFTIALNIFKAKFNKNQRFVLSEPEIFDTMYSNLLTADTQTDIIILYESMDKLPVNQKEAIYLFEILGLTQKEIAIMQGTTVVNIKLRILRGKKKLADMLKDKRMSKIAQTQTVEILESIQAI